MISFDVRHELEDHMPRHSNEFSYVNAILDGCAILLTENDGKSIFYRFPYAPPSLAMILKVNPIEGIRNAYLTLDRKFLSFMFGNNKLQIIDLQNLNGKQMILQDVTKYVALHSTPSGAMYLIQRGVDLFYTIIKTNKGISYIYSNNNKLIKKVLWWKYKSTTRILCVVVQKSSERELYLYGLNEKFSLVANFVLPSPFDEVLPTHFFLVNSQTIIIAAVLDSSAFFYTYPTNKCHAVPYPKTEKVSKIVLFQTNSLLLLSVPNVLLAIIDGDNGDLSSLLVENEELIGFETPPNLIQSMLDSSVFFNPTSLGFYDIAVNWSKLSLILECDDIVKWCFVAHIAAAHIPIKDLYIPIINNEKLFSPIGLFHFITEYYVARLHVHLETSPPALIRYIPFTVKANAADFIYNHSEKEVLEALEAAAEYPCAFGPLREVLTYAQNNFCPFGFWSPSTAIFLLMYAIGTRLPKNRFICPLNLINLPAITFPPPTSEHSWALRNLTPASIASFLKNFIDQQCAVASMLLPSDPFKELCFLLMQAHSAREFKFLIPVERLHELSSLFTKFVPKSLSLFAVRYGILPPSQIEQLIRAPGSKGPLPSAGETAMRLPSALDAEDFEPTSSMLREHLKKDEGFSHFVGFRIAMERMECPKDDIDLADRLYSLESLEARYCQ